MTLWNTSRNTLWKIEFEPRVITGRQISRESPDCQASFCHLRIDLHGICRFEGRMSGHQLKDQDTKSPPINCVGVTSWCNDFLRKFKMEMKHRPGVRSLRIWIGLSLVLGLPAGNWIAKGLHFGSSHKQWNEALSARVMQSWDTW